MCFRELQDMERVSSTDTESESESESEWDPESSTEYDSLSENDTEKKGKRREKRPKRKQTGSSSNLIQAKGTQRKSLIWLPKIHYITKQLDELRSYSLKRFETNI